MKKLSSQDADLLLGVIASIQNKPANWSTTLRNALKDHKDFLDIDWMQGDMEDRPTQRFTLLSLATAHFNHEAVRILIDEFGVNPNQANQNHETALDIAVLYDCGPLDENSDAYKTIKYLVSKGANPDLKCDNKKSAREQAKEIADLTRLNDFTKPIRDVVDYLRSEQTSKSQYKSACLNCEAAFNNAPSLTNYSYRFTREQQGVAVAVVAATVVFAAKTLLKPS